MPIPTYTPGYPPDGSSLGQTKSVIRNNLDGTFQTLNVDHVNNNGQPGSRPAGYHTVIHSVPQGSDPVAIAGYGQLYSKTINSFTNDEALFWETGGGLIQQLTVNLTPVAANSGYTFLPGGIILQWGEIVAATKNSLTVGNFVVPFPNNVFSLQDTLSAGTTGSVITLTKNSNSQFNYFINTNSGQSINFFWFAIGN